MFVFFKELRRIYQRQHRREHVRNDAGKIIKLENLPVLLTILEPKLR